jgi:adenine nucleotide transporter 17
LCCYQFTATYPLLVTTNRLQTVRRNAGTNGEITKGYENTLEAFKTILNEGVSSLYAGYESAVIGTAYSNAVYYYLYQFLNELATYMTQHKPLHLTDNILVAGLSGAATAVASNPIWVVNTRMSIEAKKGQGKNLLATLIEMVKQEGVSSLFAGVLPALILVANPVINYVLFERIQIALKSRRLNPWQLFVVSLFTKAVAAFVTHPYLVIKTRMQATQKHADAGVVNLISATLREEGIAGLFSGLSTKLVHSVLTSALLFLIKDQTTSFSINFLILIGLLKAPRMAASKA